MGHAVRILLLEDNPNDAELVRSAIGSSSMDSQVKWVDSRKAFVEAVENGAFDVILSDYRLPDFDGISALKIAKTKFPGVPFIFVSGTIGEDLAAETLKNGAADYILKDRLSKLPSAILRSLKEVETQSAQKLAEAQLRASLEERKAIERELLASLERFNLALQASNDGLWEWDTRETVYYSPRFKELLGYLETDPWPDRFSEFQSRLHPEDNNGFWSAVTRHLENRAPFDVEYRLRHKKGEYLWFRIIGLAARDSSGQPIRMVGSISDQTERKKVESQLLQAQKMQTIGTLAGGIAHDLNNQLTPINGFIDLALCQLQPHEPIYSYLTEAHLSVHRCKEIIQRLMSFSRPSTQDKKVILLKASFKEMESFFSKLLPSTIAVEIKSQEDLWPVSGNETELQTIFLNLAANARDAMPQGGKIKVDVRNMEKDEVLRIKMLNAQPYIYINFSDTGTGIPEAVLARIFEPFFTTKPVGEGTGLGLAMVFKIIQDHGGHVTVSSEAGKGTSFHIYLPAKPEAIEEIKISGRKEIKNIAREGECILFADDEEGIRNLGVLFLKRLGFQVMHAKDGEETIRMYKENRSKITLIIMDITMPKMTGKQALKNLLTFDPALIVILSSGYTAEGLVDDFLKEGAKGFIQKPYSLHVFSEVICEVLQRNLNLK